MENKISLNEWIENWNSDLYDSNSVNVQCAAGWFDWFCNENSLATRLKKMVPYILQIANSKKINKDEVYIIFKNNAPMHCNTTYDDFRICDLKTGNVLWTIVPKFPIKPPKKISMVWSSCNQFEEAVVEGTWNTVKKFFEV